MKNRLLHGPTGVVVRQEKKAKRDGRCKELARFK